MTRSRTGGTPTSRPRTRRRLALSNAATRFVIALKLAPNGERLTTAERLVLMVLACHLSEIAGTAWPAIETIAAECDLSESRTHEVIQSLVAKGALQRVGKGGRHKTNDFIITGLGKGPESQTESPKGPEVRTVAGEKGSGTPDGIEGKGPVLGGERVRFLAEKGPELRTRSSKTERVTKKETKYEEGGAVAPLAKPKRQQPMTVGPPQVSEGFISEKMIPKYADIWAAAEIRERIEQALAHKAVKNYTDFEKYVNGWLLRDAGPIRERMASGGNHSNGHGPPRTEARRDNGGAPATPRRPSPFANL